MFHNSRALLNAEHDRMSHYGRDISKRTRKVSHGLPLCRGQSEEKNNGGWRCEVTEPTSSFMIDPLAKALSLHASPDPAASPRIRRKPGCRATTLPAPPASPLNSGEVEARSQPAPTRSGWLVHRALTPEKVSDEEN
jgi:hypothetical protein